MKTARALRLAFNIGRLLLRHWIWPGYPRWKSAEDIQEAARYLAQSKTSPGAVFLFAASCFGFDWQSAFGREPETAVLAALQISRACALRLPPWEQPLAESYALLALRLARAGQGRAGPLLALALACEPWPERVARPKPSETAC